MSWVGLEVCVDTLQGAVAAADNGADRIELCAALSEGGLTPSLGFMQAAAKLPIPVYAMVRPRGGSFLYSDQEKDLMISDIQAAENTGLAGIVIGATTAGGQLDTVFLRAALAGTPLKATLHRAFDTLRDPVKGLEDAIDLGFERILTSGQAKTAEQGADLIAAAVQQAAGRISIMAGSGVNIANIETILEKTGVREIHVSCSRRAAALDPEDLATRLGFVDELGPKTTGPAIVAALAARLSDLASADR